MLQQAPSRPRHRRRTAFVGLGALALVAPVLATSPASAAPPATAVSTVMTAGISQAAQNTHHVTARAGRAGAGLGTIYVTVGISTSNPAAAKQPRAAVQQLRSGTWHTVRTAVIRDLEGPPVRLKWRSMKAATLRVTVPSLDLVSPRMKVPPAPSSTKSRYYVRKSKVGDAGAILRVFQDGTAYGIEYADLEYSCVVGRLDSPWLNLKSFDFGGWRVKYRAAGGWNNLRINDGATPVGGPRMSLTGTNKRYFGFCAAPTYASVSTDPGAI